MQTFQTTRQPLYAPRNNNPPPAGIGRFAREISLFSGFGVLVWWALSLWTYSKEDAAWTTSGESPALRNFCGTTGAWVADISYFLFGGSVWWILLALFWLGWMFLIQRAPASEEDIDSSESDTPPFQFRLLAFVGGMILLLCASTTLEWSWLSRMEGRLPNHSGGILGYSIGFWSVKLLGFSEIGLISIVLMLVGMAWVFHFSWLQLSEWLGANLEHFLQMIWQRLEQIRDRKLGQRAMRERESNMYDERVGMPAPLAPAKSHKHKGQEAQDSSLDSSIDEEYPTWEEAEAAATEAAAKQAEQETLKTAVTEPPVPFYHLPSLALLARSDPPAATGSSGLDSDTLAATARLIEKRLGDLGVKATLGNPQTGPLITSYEVAQNNPNNSGNADDSDNTETSKTNLADIIHDLARNLNVPAIRVADGNSAVLELPNAKRQTVGLGSVLETVVWQESESLLTVALGQDSIGNPIVLDLAKMPHVLMAGVDGSGKSMGIHTAICSLLFRAEARDVRLLLIDPKMQKLPIYEGIPHLITPVVEDVQQAINSLAWCVAEMNYRYQLMRKLGVSSMVEFNQKIIQAKRRGELFYCPESPRNPRQPMGHLPYIVIVINELADLMVGHRKQVQTLIACLAQKARATGIHLVVTTKNPHDNVVTELIRANIPARIAFQVHSRVDSTTILNTHGAETLLGMGDMLYRSGNTETIVRVHGAFISMEEIQAVVNHIRDQCPVPDYVPHVLDTPVSSALETIGKGEDDPIYEQVMIFLLDKQITSAPELERRFKITHQRAIELLAQMEKTGIVSTMGHAGKRDVLTQNFSLINNKNATP